MKSYRLETDDELRDRVFACMPGWGAMASVAVESTGTSLDDVAWYYGLVRAQIDTTTSEQYCGSKPHKHSTVWCEASGGDPDDPDHTVGPNPGWGSEYDGDPEDSGVNR